MKCFEVPIKVTHNNVFNIRKTVVNYEIIHALNFFGR